MQQVGVTHLLRLANVHEHLLALVRHGLNAKTYDNIAVGLADYEGT